MEHGQRTAKVTAGPVAEAGLGMGQTPTAVLPQRATTLLHT